MAIPAELLTHSARSLPPVPYAPLRAIPDPRFLAPEKPPLLLSPFQSGRSIENPHRKASSTGCSITSIDEYRRVRVRVCVSHAVVTRA